MKTRKQLVTYYQDQVEKVATAYGEGSEYFKIAVLHLESIKAGMKQEEIFDYAIKKIEKAREKELKKISDMCKGKTKVQIACIKSLIMWEHIGKVGGSKGDAITSIGDDCKKITMSCYYCEYSVKKMLKSSITSSCSICPAKGMWSSKNKSNTCLGNGSQYLEWANNDNAKPMIELCRKVLKKHS